MKINISMQIETDDGLEIDLDKHFRSKDAHLLIHSNKIGANIGSVKTVFWAVDAEKSSDGLGACECNSNVKNEGLTAPERNS